MDIVLRIGELTVGLLLLYVRYGLYETQEGKLHDRLADLWIQIEDYSPTLQRRVSRLLTQTARISLVTFDAVFGSRTVSIQSISSAILLVFISTTGTVYLMAVVQGTTLMMTQSDVVGLLMIGGSTLLLVRQNTKWCRLVSYVIAASICALILGRSDPLSDRSDLGFIVAFIFTIVAEITWLAVQRSLLRRAYAQNEADGYAALALAVSSAVAIATFAVPLYLAELGITDPFWGIFNEVVGLARMSAILISLVQLVILLLFVLHRVFWPLLARIVYSLERHEVFHKRTLFGPLGAILAAHSILGKWLVSGIKLL